jgi:ABC-type dipeptide/oligopeptide/nickel transport system permease subunit
VLALLAAIVLVPLGREYADLRRSFGLGRIGAFATTALVLPSLGVAIVLALPLNAHPVAQWVAIVVTTFAVYSLATRAIVASASSADTAPSRSTRG